MRVLPFDLCGLLHKGGGARERTRSARAVREKMGTPAAGEPDPYETYWGWWLRYAGLCRWGEVPDWTGFAAFRYIVDYNLTVGPDGTARPFPRRPEGLVVTPAEAERLPVALASDADLWKAYLLYFEKGMDFRSGKPELGGAGEEFFLGKQAECRRTLGGQAGNILWLWATIGANRRGYVPQVPRNLRDLVERSLLADIQGTEFLEPEGGYRWTPFAELTAGVRSDAGRGGAPSGGSFVASRGGRRLIYQLKGFRDLDCQQTDPPWDSVQYLVAGVPLGRPQAAVPSDTGDLVWPNVPLFLDTRIRGRVLELDLAGERQIEEAFRGKVDLAVLGGLHMLFQDRYVKEERTGWLRQALVGVARRQLLTLKRCGVRIGMELSTLPDRETLGLLGEWCRDGIVVCLGINGEDELGDVTGAGALAMSAVDLFLDPTTVPADFRHIAADPRRRDPGFEYVTYLRARRLAEATGVRTVYVHNTGVDLVLRRDADPGSLLRAQEADMLGKGLVVAALMRRAFGDRWEARMAKIALAIPPDAFLRLWSFARDFERHQATPGAAARLFESGYWLAPSPREYSVAAVPVLWPALENFARTVNEKGDEDASPGAGPPEDGASGEFSATGAGDMTFGAFFLLGGV